MEHVQRVDEPAHREHAEELELAPHALRLTIGPHLAQTPPRLQIAKPDAPVAAECRLDHMHDQMQIAAELLYAPQLAEHAQHMLRLSI